MIKELEKTCSLVTKLTKLITINMDFGKLHVSVALLIWDICLLYLCNNHF